MVIARMSEIASEPSREPIRICAVYHEDRRRPYRQAATTTAPEKQARRRVGARDAAAHKADGPDASDGAAWFIRIFVICPTALGASGNVTLSNGIPLRHLRAQRNFDAIGKRSELNHQVVMHRP